MSTDKLYADWLLMGKRYTSNEGLLKDVYDKLIAAYNESNRYYHGLIHVINLLHAAEEEYVLQIPDDIFYAIWFHDAVYNSVGDNEGKSAKLAAKYLPLMQVPTSIISGVEAMILKTANHLDAVADNEHEAFFLDADMAILGTAKEVYDKYKQAVRKEYRIYPDIVYNMGRRKFLAKALAAPRIFKTDGFYKRYEAQARVNLKRELEELD